MNTDNNYAAYLRWWVNEGSGMPPLANEDAEEHVRRITEIAWLNGAYCARAELAKSEAAGPSIEDLGPLISWLAESATQSADAGRSRDAGMLTWAAQVVGERVDEDAPESAPVGPSLQWSENKPPSEECRYDHCIAETPFGRFLITWKSWKQFDSPTVDEAPWGIWCVAFDSVDAAKAACQRELDERLARWVNPLSTTTAETP
jgi:hypothetical protein